MQPPGDTIQLHYLTSYIITLVESGLNIQYIQRIGPIFTLIQVDHGRG